MNTYSEKTIQKALQDEIGGQTEVLTPVGRIDLLTDKELIEVKDAKNWKAAIGQIISYGKYYPDHHKVLYLYGDISETQFSLISETCESQDIFVVRAGYLFKWAMANLFLREELYLHAFNYYYDALSFVGIDIQKNETVSIVWGLEKCYGCLSHESKKGTVFLKEEGIIKEICDKLIRQLKEELEEEKGRDKERWYITAGIYRNIMELIEILNDDFPSEMIEFCDLLLDHKKSGFYSHDIDVYLLHSYMANGYSSIGNYESAIWHYKRLLEMNAEIKWEKGDEIAQIHWISYSYSFDGYGYGYYEDFEFTRGLYQPKSYIPLSKREILKEITKNYYKMRKFSLAIYYSQKAEEQPSGDNHLTYYYEIMANSHFYLGNYHKAILYARKALDKVQERFRDPEGNLQCQWLQIEPLTIAGISYAKLENYVDAIEHIETAKEIAIVEEEIENEFKCIKLLAEIKAKMEEEPIDF